MYFVKNKHDIEIQGESMSIRQSLSRHKILVDGAFGTYYASITGNNELPEKANVENPELVKKIHKEYLAAGARLIRTNTFASNTYTLGCNNKELKKQIRAGYELAKQAVQEFKAADALQRIIDGSCVEEKEEIYIAGDIGPIYTKQCTKEEVQQEYEEICETFIEAGAEILVFETFPDIEIIGEVIKRVKKKQPELFIVTQFCMNQYGYSGTGVSAKHLFERASQNEAIDAIGFNCGVGPGHLYHILKKLPLNQGKYITALPNASYPKMSKSRMIFMDNIDYFGQQMKEIAELGIDLIGGCCGTNPQYIGRIKEQVDLAPVTHDRAQVKQTEKQEKRAVGPSWLEGKKAGEKLLAVELSPPIDADCEKIMDAANILKQSGVDVITFPDSPSGRMRADSILMSVKVAKEVKIHVMPHICCRDRNAIAIRSELLGAHMNGVKDFLVVTGDPVPAAIRQDVKNVFNFDSVGIMKTIQEMDEEQFKEDPIAYGGALGYNKRNIEVEISRMKKKIAAGASFFLSQPVFTSEDVEKLRYMKSQVDTKILCGIMPLVSIRNARFIKNEMADIHVTDEIINLFSPEMSKEEGEAVGVKIARKMIAETKDFVDGYYFSIPFNRVYLLEQMLSE